MMWLYIAISLILTIVGIAVVLAHFCFDDEDPDQFPNDSFH